MRQRQIESLLMLGNVFINEVRIPLTSLHNFCVLKYRASGLSSGHKKRLEQLLWTQERRVSIFEGDILFSLINQDKDPDDEMVTFATFLGEQIRQFKSTELQAIVLKTVPARVVERLAFALLRSHASRQGFFTIYGRTLFKPTSEKGKEAHLAVETMALIEDGFVKLYIFPTYIGLANIENSHRKERFALELVGLCSFRTECDLAMDDGSCPYIIPGRLGYYEREAALTVLSDTRQEAFTRSYKKCPEISTVDRVVFAKATKKADKFFAYPPYVVHSRLSDEDLVARTNIARKYRNATLMLSCKRFEQSRKRLKEIFLIDDDTLRKGEIDLWVGGVKVPVKIELLKAHPLTGRDRSDYRALWIPEQKVVNNPKEPHGRPFGGAWLFSKSGALDREDTNRPFDKVYPYVILPNDLPQTTQMRRLLRILSDGTYKPIKSKGDKEFLGTNQTESRKKYNVDFVNPWDEEEGIIFVDNTESDYLRAAQDIKRQWNASNKKDRTRIVIVAIPTSATDDDEVTLYHKLKTVFVEEGIPSQFISFDTLAKLEDGSTAFGPILDSLWLNIYAKMGGKPWRLASELGNVHSFIGLGFGRNSHFAGRHIFLGVAHVFDKYGNWLDVTTGSRKISPNDLQSFEGKKAYLEGTASFKISQDTTEEIIYDALDLYEQQQTQTGEPAKNIVLHKLGPIHECELIGFMEGVTRKLGTLNDCRFGVVQIEQEHNIRLYGDAIKGNSRLDRTILRGASLILNETKMVLATTGRVHTSSKDYYPGIGTPQPLLLTSRMPSNEILDLYGCKPNQFYDIESLGKHVMALTQLHWGSTRSSIRLPITTLYAQKVADLVSKTGARVDTWSSYHRPWFL